MTFFRQLRALLPGGEAWRAVVDGLLRRYLEALATLPAAARLYFDQVYGELFPSTTSQLPAWAAQFGLNGKPSIAAVDSAWKATGGQGKDYIEGLLRAAGFNLTIHGPWASDVGQPYGIASASVESFGSFPGDVVGPWPAPNGERLYAAATGGGGDSVIRAYAPATAWAFTGGLTLSETSPELTGFANVVGVFMKPDGTRIFIYDLTPGSGNRRVAQFDLATAFDVSTLDVGSVVSITLLSPPPPTLFPGFTFSADGLQLYVSRVTSSIVSYDLPSAWDLTGLGVSSSALLAIASNAGAFKWSRDGSLFFVLYTDTLKLTEFATAVPFSLGDLVATGAEADLSAADTTAADFFFDPTGARLWTTSAAAIFEWYLAVPIAKIPQLYVESSLVGTIQCGDAAQMCGVTGTQCNSLITSNQGYLVNFDQTARPQPPIQTDPDTFGQWIYVGGELFPDRVTIEEARIEELFGLLLQYCPTEKWIGLLVDFVPTIPPVTTDLVFSFYADDPNLPGPSLIYLSDSSGNQNDISHQGPSGYAVKVDDWSNTLPAVRGNSGLWYENRAPAGAGGAAFTIAIVGEWPASSPTAGIASGDVGDSGLQMIAGVPFVRDSAGTDHALTAAPFAGDKFIWLVTMDGASSESRFIVNAGGEFTDALNLAAGTLSELRLLGNRTNIQGFTGLIGQALFYNRALTAPERQLTTNYLLGRYGLTESPPAPPPPDFVEVDENGFIEIDTDGFVITS